MGKRLFDVVKTNDDIKKIMGAIADGIDTLNIQEALEELGLEVEVDTVDWGHQFGKITIEGGENETGVILTLQLSQVDVDFDTLNIAHRPEVSPEQMNRLADVFRTAWGEADNRPDNVGKRVNIALEAVFKAIDEGHI